MTADPVRPDDEFLVFGKPAIGEEEKEEVLDSLASGWLGTGPKVQRFEEDFRRYTGGDHAAAVNSCTAAMHLSLLTAGIGPGDEVVTTPMTFCSTVNVILHAGATPVLADVDPATMNVDPAKVQEAVTDRTAALLPVHLAGRPARMGPLMEIAEDHDLAVIEDAAHAVEATIDERHAGTFGDFGCFSFYATKNVVTGEGGMALIRDEGDAERFRVLSLHGMTRDAWKRYSDAGYQHYQVVEPGWKYNMMDLQAALGIHQLERVEDNWERRRGIWERYQDAFADLPVGTPAPVRPGTRHAYHLYTLRIDEQEAGIHRDAFLEGMHTQNIGTGVHYLSIPEHPYYQKELDWDPDDFPHAKRIGRETASIPLAPNLTERDVDDVIEAVERVVG